MVRVGILASVVAVVSAGVVLPALGGNSKQGNGAQTRNALLVSSAPDRSNAKPLKGRAAYGSIYVFLRDTDDVRRVRYFVDDPRMERAPYRISTKAPFDLAGTGGGGKARGLDTLRLTHGRHVITAEIEDAGGATRVIQGAFAVKHLFMAPGGGGDACTKSRPCVSFAAAYNVARPGQVVEIADGSYPGAEIEFDPRKTSPDDVVFRPAEGARITVEGEIRLTGAKHVTFSGMKVGDFFIGPINNSGDPGQRPEDITLINIDQQFFFVRAGIDVRIVGGSVGGRDDAIAPTIGTYAGQPPSQNISIDGVLFHDITRKNSPEEHIECLFIQESDRVSVRRSRFTRCDVFDLFVNTIVDGRITNLTLENNFFGQPTGGGFQAVAIYPMRGGVIRYNSFASALNLRPGAYTDFSVVGNAGYISDCTRSITFAFNVWSNDRCGRSDVRRDPGFVDPAGYDLHLKQNAGARNRGDPNDHPSLDIDGQKRPNGKPDAGADEHW
jgi:hypothetical protein